MVAMHHMWELKADILIPVLNKICEQHKNCDPSITHVVTQSATATKWKALDCIRSNGKTKTLHA